MKRMILLAMALVVFTVQFAFAEASFDQIQELIKQQNYSAAIKGLEVIIKNHPNSAKAFYAMSQAQAGIGNQVKAKEALDIATGIDPKLKFASSGNVEQLKEAITPQTKKIQAIESHTGRNILLALLFIGGAIGMVYVVRKKKASNEPTLLNEKVEPEPECDPAPFRTNDSPMHTSASQMARVVDTKTVAPAPADIPNKPYAYQPISPAYRPVPAPTRTETVHHHHNNSGNDMLTGVLVGSMLNNNSRHDHHETRVVEREVVREEPQSSRSASWDTPASEERSSSWDTPKSEERSSSWDSPSETTRSSSWDSSSDSSSSSSWSSSDSSSSSSDSGSSSSWD